MFQIAIVEDDAAWRSQLKQEIERFGREERIDISVQAWESGFSFLENYHEKDFDIILLDIEMPHFSGMETARQIRAQDESVCLIFVTNMAQYALEGYSVSAKDYILKPVNYETLRQRLKNAIDHCRRYAAEGAIMLNRGGGFQRLDVSDIYYIEADGHSLVYHTARGQYTELRETLKNRETELLPMHFIRCNHYLLVNMRHVRSLKNGELTLSDGSNVQISRSKRKECMLRLADYMGNRL